MRSCDPPARWWYHASRRSGMRTVVCLKRFVHRSRLAPSRRTIARLGFGLGGLAGGIMHPGGAGCVRWYCHNGLAHRSRLAPSRRTFVLPVVTIRRLAGGIMRPGGAGCVRWYCHNGLAHRSRLAPSRRTFARPDQAFMAASRLALASSVEYPAGVARHAQAPP
jgi:hypothetical protein